MDKKEKKQCITCLEYKNPKTEFYLSHSSWHSDNRVPICKKCLRSAITDEENERKVREVLRAIDKPFKADAWKTAKEDKKETLGMYLKNISFAYKDANYDDSDFGTIENSSPNYSKNNDEDQSDNKKQDSNTPSDYLIDKWGVGYKPELYSYFERKYNILKNNYQEKTSMHREGLLTYIRFRVQEELATAEGDVKAAKEWGALASKAAQDAKINPSQLSKADLSDGLDTFGQLVRTVEQAEDIIPQLPQFKAKPQDSVDFTIWCYINYIRDLKGLPLAEYKDVYDFYEQRKREYENRLDEGDDN